MNHRKEDDLERGNLLGGEAKLDIPKPATAPSASWSIVKIITAIAIGTIVFCLALSGLDDSRFFRIGGYWKHKSSTCKNSVIRREWRAQSPAEKKDFINAVVCLSHSPSKLGLNTTRYDDFVYNHVQSYEYSHRVAPSFPWHRYFINTFEKALKEECGLKGNLPYWDWSLDAYNPSESPIWDHELGFGHNGVGNDTCVQTGPFTHLRPHYPKQHCLQRDFYLPGMYGFGFHHEKVNWIVNNAEDYHDFRTRVEMGPHKAVHNGIGGDMPTHGSSNDPVFWIHHAQIDRLWWLWQQKNPGDRLTDYYGNNQLGTEDEQAEFRRPWMNAVIDDTIHGGDLAPDIKVSDIMETETDVLCYRYEL